MPKSNKYKWQKGWELYFQGQIGNVIVFYFIRNNDVDKSKINYKLTAQEEALL